MKVLLKSKIKILAWALNDYLLAWIENQSRTPNDRYAFEHNIWPITIKRMNEPIETNT